MNYEVNAGSSHEEPQGMYQCGVCKRSYKRLDHLSRHARTHSQSRPHKCHICSKSFTRTDLLKRHIAAHERQNSRPDHQAPIASRENRPPLGRVSLACKGCSVNHLRCTDDKPCKRCIDRDIECIWDAPLNADLAFTPPTTDCEETQAEASLPTVAPAYEPQTVLAEEEIEVDMADEATSQDFRESSGMQGDGIVVDPAMIAAPFPFLDGTHGSSSLNFLTAHWPVFEDDLVLDAGLPGDLEDVQYSYLNSHDGFPFGTGRGGGHGQDGGQEDAAAAEATVLGAAYDEPPSRGSSDSDQPAAMCTESLRNSHWHFRPGTKDFAGAEQHHLSLPQDSDFDSPESRIPVPVSPGDSILHINSMSVLTRDRILTMVVKNANPSHVPEAGFNFPSTQLLDTLVRLYLHSTISRAASFIHIPTFVTNDQRPELLAAMVACGAVLTANTALTKLGFAIAEIARMAIARLWDGDNTLVRDLRLLQGFCIILELGLWSGHSRRVEIAESFLQPLVTMMRRAGKFRRAGYAQTARNTEPSQPESERVRKDWLDWAEAESFKRLAFRLLQHDADSSMALLVNPIISYTEAQLPLPDSTVLWSAVTAGQWKMGFPSRSNLQLLSAGDVIDNPDSLNRHAGTVDAEIASRAALSLGWRLTWEYTRMVSFQKLQPRQFNALIVKLRLDELSKLLSGLEMSLSSGPAASPGLTLRLELLHLHLHMPFDDVQTFAGMQGASQARDMQPSIREWALGESARRAVFHAAQVLRASRDLPHAFIQGPEAIMLYYASLALSVYGFIAEKRSAGGVSSSSVAVTSVYLDDPEESTALRRFIEFGVGRPCIRRGNRDEQPEIGRNGPAVYLDRPDMVLEVIVVVVEANFKDAEMAQLTQKLMQIVEELRNAARRFLRSTAHSKERK